MVITLSTKTTKHINNPCCFNFYYSRISTPLQRERNRGIRIINISFFFLSGLSYFNYLLCLRTAIYAQVLFMQIYSNPSIIISHFVRSECVCVRVCVFVCVYGIFCHATGFTPSNKTR